MLPRTGSLTTPRARGVTSAVLLSLGLSAAAPLACSSAPPPPVVTTLVVPPPAAAPPPSASASPATPPPPAADAPIPMYPVARIYSLFDIVATDGGIELRLGLDPGGGMNGTFRYVPLVDGVPDFERETGDIHRAYTSGGFLELVGKRPDLIYHETAGFRSSAQDHYRLPDRDSTLGDLQPPSASGLGMGLFAWSKGRWLEWRGPDPVLPASASGAVLPQFRVLVGSDREAPSLSRALQAQLTKERFVVDTVTALRTGEVVAVGRLAAGRGFGTLIWRGDLRQPQYFTTETVAVGADGVVGILGGASLAEIRLEVDDKVLRLDGATWVVESTTAKGALPDVWFGTTLLRSAPEGMFARLARGAPWRPVGKLDEEVRYAVDPAGVIWKTEGELLLSSKPPSRPVLEMSEHDLVALRKASVLRGGSDDETGAPPTSFGQRQCRMSYVLLDQAPEGAAPADYPAIRAALKGHPELGAVRFVVSRERRSQLFGALVADADVAAKLAVLVKKRVKSAPTWRMCAEPPVVREIKIDLRSGALIP